MKKVILYILAVIGGAMSGMLAGALACILTAGPICGALLMFGFDVDSISEATRTEYFVWWMRIASPIGAMVTPYLLREKINEWSAG
jgi:hypothetical protein